MSDIKTIYTIASKSKNDILRVYKTLICELICHDTLKGIAASLGQADCYPLSLGHIEYVYISNEPTGTLTAIVNGEKFPELEFWRDFMNRLGNRLACESPITVSACVAFNGQIIKTYSLNEIMNKAAITSEFH